MIIIFTFDDGRKDAILAASILSKNHLCGTFFVTTGFIDGSFKTNAFGIDRKPLTIEDLLRMKMMGMEIASHSDKHVFDSNDFLLSVEKLHLFGLTSENRVGFSIPNSKYDIKKINDFTSENGEILKYIRVGRHKDCYKFGSKIKYLLFKIFKTQHLYNSFNQYNIVTRDSFDKFLIPSLVIKKTTTFEKISKFIEKNSASDTFLVLMFHSIVDNPSNSWEWRTNDFEKLCEFVRDNGKIKCCTLYDLLDKNKMEKI